MGQKLEDKLGNQGEIEVVARHEALDAPHARQRVGLSAEGCRELGEVDGAQNDDGLNHLGEELYAC